MNSASERAVVDDYVDALLAPVEALHAEPQELASPRASVAAVSSPATALAPAPAPARLPAAAESPPRLREPATAAAARLAVAIADATAPEPPASSTAAKPARWLRVSIEHDRYAVELLRVQEVVRMAPIVAMRGAAVAVLGVMNLRGRIVPVYDLGLWLGAGEVRPDDRARIVVVEHDDELLGVLVSSVDDVVTLADDGIEPPYDTGPRKRRAADRAIRGIARPGGLPTVLLDANALFE
jgi:purine-binding chemotaxis protein CheW